jgi:diguanylate cyclase (GGDEF)-like protein
MRVVLLLQMAALALTLASLALAWTQVATGTYEWQDGVQAAALLCLLLAVAAAAVHTARNRQQRGYLKRILEADRAADLPESAARLKGRVDRLSGRRDRDVLQRLTLAEAIAEYEAAQQRLDRAQDDLLRSLDDARDEIERLRVANVLDELTGALKYPYLVHRVKELLRELLDRSQAFCLLELDLDNFKDINDTFGHAAGDDALREFAALLRSACREHDLVVRKSGDEFFVVAPRTSLDEALVLGERLRAAVNSHTVVSVSASGDRQMFPLAASIGVLDVSTADVSALRTVVDPDLAVREVLSYVDAALYRAKHAGKNCVREYQAGLRVVDLATEVAPPDLPRINRLARSRYGHLAEAERQHFDELLSEASELLFPKKRAGRRRADFGTVDGPGGTP